MVVCKHVSPITMQGFRVESTVPYAIRPEWETSCSICALAGCALFTHFDSAHRIYHAVCNGSTRKLQSDVVSKLPCTRSFAQFQLAGRAPCTGFPQIFVRTNDTRGHHCTPRITALSFKGAITSCNFVVWTP